MPEATRLDYDCWLLVLDHLAGEFDTLSRILQVSRHFFHLTVPHLYSQLGLLANETQIDTWSIRKRHRVVALLLASSKIRSGDKGNCDCAIISLHNLHTGKPSSRLPLYSTPLSVNYLDHVKRLPANLVGRIWTRCMEIIRQNKQFIQDPFHFAEFAAQHAQVLTEVAIETRVELDAWMSLVLKLSNLERLSIQSFINLNLSILVAKKRLYEFVMAHKTAFPGQLSQICTTDMDPQVLGMVMELNTVLEPTWIDLTVFEGIEQQFTDLNLSQRLSKNLTKIRFSESCNNSFLFRNTLAVFHFGQVLQQSRNLEAIEIVSWAKSLTSFSDLFTWAPRELSEAVATRSSSSQQKATSTLVPMSVKSFTGTMLPGYVLTYVLDGFRDSIEKIDFSCSLQDLTVGDQWSWILARLTVLKLSYCSIPVSKFSLCPVLEELYLTDITLQMIDETSHWNHGTWVAMPSLKILHLVGDYAIDSLDLESLAQLTNLEELVLDHTVNVRCRMHDISLYSWSLPKLKILTLRNWASYGWQRGLLNAAPNLEKFSLPTDLFKMTDHWMFESNLASFRHLVWDDADNDRQSTKEKMDSWKTDTRPSAASIEADHCDEIWWNGHTTKIKSLEFGGVWTGEKFEGLTKLLRLPKEKKTTSGMLSKVFSKSFFSSTSVTPSQLPFVDFEDRVRFPNLRHLKLCEVHQQGRGVFNGLVKSIMERPGMERIEVMQWALSGEFIRAEFQEIDKDWVPPFRLDMCEDLDVSIWTKKRDDLAVSRSHCILAIDQRSGGSRYFRLKAKNAKNSK